MMNEESSCSYSSCATIVMQFAIAATGETDEFGKLYEAHTLPHHVFFLFFYQSLCFPGLYNAGGKQNVIMANTHKGQTFKNNTQVDKYQNVP